MTRIRFAALAGTLAGAAALAACATIEEGVVEETGDTYRASLTGAQEVPNGDPDGSGQAENSVSDDFDQVCWDINNVRGIGPITAAHIHRGARGVNGPPVFTLRRADEGGYKGCTDGSEWAQDRIENNPEMFYVNVHTAEYPNGAIRGQLSR